MPGHALFYTILPYAGPSSGKWSSIPEKKMRASYWNALINSRGITLADGGTQFTIGRAPGGKCTSVEVLGVGGGGASRAPVSMQQLTVPGTRYVVNRGQK
jgi:hypothetical protein